tara:strand:+ start:1556 stop:2818 length:1263 start_codon:yes stop_codon:yes gene_type:complete
MAQIITYPKLSTLANNDLLLVSDVSSPNKTTNSLEIDTLAQYIIVTNSVIKGGGTVNKLAMFTPTGDSIGDSFIRQDDPAAGGTVYVTPTDLGASGDFQFGTGGSFSSLPAADGYEFRKQNGGFYKKTFKFESKEGISIGRSSIQGNVILDVGDAADTKPAAWFRNGVVLSNNPAGVQVDNTSMVIGAGNNDIISGSDNCLAVGNNNQVTADSDHSLTVGQGNTMSNADNSICVGQQNNLTGRRLYVLGFSNQLTCASAFALGGDNNVTGLQNNFAIGYNNTISGTQKNITIGSNNTISNFGGNPYSQAAIIGNNCRLNTPVSGNANEFGMVVIGSNNAQKYPGATSGVPFRPKIVLAAEVNGPGLDALVISDALGGIASMIQSPALLTYNFADDPAAEAGGIPLGGLYHNDGEVRIRRL